MNIWLVLAGLVSLLTCAVHVFAGGPEIHDPTLASSLGESVKGVWSVVWHMATFAIFLNGIMFLFAAKKQSHRTEICLYPIAMTLAAVLLFLFYGITRFHSVLIMPQWIAFATVANLAIIGLLRRT